MINIYLTNLGKYNEGQLVGQWVELPVYDDFKEAFENIGINQFYEEYFITDYESDLGLSISEYENIFELNKLAQQVEELTESEIDAITAYLEVCSDDVKEAIDAITSGRTIYFDNTTLEEVAEDIIEGYEMPDFCRRYFDIKSFARELSFEGYHESKYGVLFVG